MSLTSHTSSSPAKSTAKRSRKLAGKTIGAKTYSMASRDVLAGLGSAVIETRLNRMCGPALPGRSTVINVENVEGIKEYQKQDIDLVVHVRNYKNDNRTEVVTIEVKADNYPSGDITPDASNDIGNFFFETVSNDSKAIRTEGCFMYTNARMLYYLFLPTGTLYQLPTDATRDWFKKELGYTDDWYHPEKCDLHALRKKDPRWRFTSTTIGGRVAYNTWGVVLPVKQVLRDIEAATGKTIQKHDVLEDVVRVGHTRGVLLQVWEKMPELTRRRAAVFLHKHGLPFAPALKYLQAHTPSSQPPKIERRVLVWNLTYNGQNGTPQPRQLRWSNWDSISWNFEKQLFEFAGARGFAGVITRDGVDAQFPGMVEAYIAARNLGSSNRDSALYMKSWWSKHGEQRLSSSTFSTACAA